MSKIFDSAVNAIHQEAIAEQITLQRVDEAAAIARPNTVGHTWVEREYDEIEAEQEPLWTASGIEKSRRSAIDAAGAQAAATASEHIVAGHLPVLDAAAIRFANTAEALSPFRRRPPGTKLFHYGAKAGFLLGDVAGISTAAIWGGEIPGIAVIMASSAAIATVTAGLTGTEARDLRSSRRRERDVKSLTEKQHPFQHLFTGGDAGNRIVRSMVGVSAAVGALIGCAIFALRFSIQGPLVGLVYGVIAVAIAAASFIESYMYTDEVADQIDNADHSYAKEIARHAKLAASEPRKIHSRSLAEADSIAKEHAERGRAARDRVRSHKWAILRRNPGVVGHGTAQPNVATVGKTVRRGGDAK
jgi:hypothetical protein